MRFYLSKVDSLLNNIKQGKIKALLLYGPDKGYINAFCKSIIDQCEFIQRSISYQDINRSSLSIILNAQNFFNDKEFIKICGVNDYFNEELNNELQKKFLNFAVFIGDDLSSKSRIKKLFEKEHDLASLGCYYCTDNVIAKVAIDTFRSYNKTISDDVVNYLKLTLKDCDYQFIQNELDKIVYFTYDKNSITLVDVQSVISFNFNINIDSLCIFFMKKERANFIEEINKLQHNKVSSILIIRRLIQYYMDLYYVLSYAKNGMHLDDACQSLPIPIFFKYLNDFKTIAKRINMQQVIKILSELQNIELQIKTYNTSISKLLNLL